MNNLRFRRRTGVLLIAVCVACGTLRAQTQPQRPPPPKVDAWTWTDGSGKVKTADDLWQVIALHQQWLRSTGATGARANLANAKLASLTLQGTDLRNAVLTAADLSGVHFTAVNLNGADLSGAFISQADMPWSQLRDANLSSASLLGSNLSNSNMKGAHMDRALLVSSKFNNVLLDNADLRSAGIIDTDLSGAKLYGADLDAAAFEPSSPPDVRSIANAFHLEHLTFNTSPDALTALRHAFVDGGYLDQRNKMTYALKHQENAQRWRRAGSSKCTDPSCRTEQLLGQTCANGACQGHWLNYISYALNWVAFDWTVRYGMEPERALTLLMALWLVCSLVYFGFIHFATSSGLALVKHKTRRTFEAFRSARFRPRRIRPAAGWRYAWSWLRREWHVLRVCMFFSLLSTFHNGFNDLDPGKWIRLLTKRDYNLEPTQWMRTVAGLQTMVSLFLFAMWVLTQFGHPFET